MTKILDCTLRDGGYYTQWDFDSKIVESYIQAMNRLPVDYIEIGYRNLSQKEYLGKFGYTPISVLKQIRKRCNKKIVLMLNEKSTLPENLQSLIKPIANYVDMIRIAIDPKNFDRAVILAREVKKMGFEVGFNCMYMSKWTSDYPGFLTKLSVLNDFCDLFCMVDSYGGVSPKELENIFNEVKVYTSVPIGFHGHNNLQLGLINTITAINLGVDYVDVTVLGMGRGAGNLNTELLLTYLNANNGLDVDFNVLGDVITAFTPLLEKYHWGTNLPYMIAGANKIPQKEVMDWVTNRVYSFNSIVRALDNRKNKTCDNAKYPILEDKQCFQKVLVIGGGENTIIHFDAIKEYILNNKEDIALVFATSRYADSFIEVNVPKYYCLNGSESRRLTNKVGEKHFSGKCILPPYPRIMGTEVPTYAEKYTFELESIDLIDQYKDSVTSLALQLAMQLSNNEIMLIGYDGYPGNVLSEKETVLTNENRAIFQAYYNAKGENLKSLTQTLYKDLDVTSVYQLI